jgi:hypothetical protein
MDYTYPSIFFSYLLFFLFLGGGVYFLARSAKDGYWGDRSEDAKYRMLEDDDSNEVKHAR